MIHPLFPFPQFAGGVLALVVGGGLAALGVVSIFIAIIMKAFAYPDDQWIAKVTAKTAGISTIAAVLGPILVGDWSIVIPILMILWVAWYISTK